MIKSGTKTVNWSTVDLLAAPDSASVGDSSVGVSSVVVGGGKEHEMLSLRSCS